MIAFLKIEEQVNSIFETFAEEHHFRLIITDYEVEMTNNVCKILISTDRYYPELRMKLINPRKAERNIYEINKIMQLHNNHKYSPSFGSNKDSSDEARISLLNIFLNWLNIYCHDSIKGNFDKLDNLGYWNL